MSSSVDRAARVLVAAAAADKEVAVAAVLTYAPRIHAVGLSLATYYGKEPVR